MSGGKFLFPLFRPAWVCGLLTVNQSLHVRVCRLILTGLMVGGLLMFTVACSSTGQSFRASALSQMTEGQTTFQEAVQLLGNPTQVYPQDRGVVLAQWRHADTVLVDAIYFRQELLLQFAANGRFQRVVDKTNILASPKSVSVGLPVAVKSGRPGAKPVSAGNGHSIRQTKPADLADFPDSLVMEEVTVSYPIWLPVETIEQEKRPVF